MTLTSCCKTCQEDAKCTLEALSQSLNISILRLKERASLRSAQVDAQNSSAHQIALKSCQSAPCKEACRSGLSDQDAVEGQCVGGHRSCKLQAADAAALRRMATSTSLAILR